MSKRRRGESADFILTEHQVERVLKACLDLVDRLIVGCSLFMGMKASEIVHMCAGWVTDDGNLKVPSQMACNCAECARKRGGTWKPKTRAAARTLPIPKRLRADLATLLKMQPYGLGISRQGLYYRVQAIGKRAKVKDISPDILRATCFTMLKERGMDVQAFCYFTGQKSIAVGRIIEARDTALKEARTIFG